MYELGPSYLGSFQSPFVNKNTHSVSTINIHSQNHTNSVSISVLKYMYIIVDSS